jgi:hypothetical protein
MALGYLIGVQASSAMVVMVVMVRRTLGSMRTVTEKWARLRRQAATNDPA